MQKLHNLWLANSGVSYRSTGEEQEILQADGIPWPEAWLGGRADGADVLRCSLHHAGVLFSSAACAGSCHEHHCLSNTAREESFLSLLEKVQNEQKQRNQLVPAEVFQCQLWSWEWNKMYISGWQHVSSATADIIYFPLFHVMILARFFPFSWVFSSSPSGLHNQTWRISRARSSCAELGKVPAGLGCLSCSKGHMCDHCLPPGSRQL